MGGWDFGVFQCEQNPVMCLWAWCVPGGICCMQVVDAKISDSENKNAAFVACLCSCFLGCIGATFNRYKLREMLTINDSVIMDLLWYWWVPCFAVTQEWMTTMNRQKNNHKLLIWQLIGAQEGGNGVRA
ncbi:unnamed protein product [Blepharisma stoltei]|uniref:Uncharacterized protein n=1 Tax=Blepharisma stoltei TaxID=1481888 RepID=A0AAU9JQ67_9CILI|nr:unnamed protein product [Blepharisma stoltei]